LLDALEKTVTDDRRYRTSMISGKSEGRALRDARVCVRSGGRQPSFPFSRAALRCIFRPSRKSKFLAFTTSPQKIPEKTAALDAKIGRFLDRTKTLVPVPNPNFVRLK
jgi:hypothetical protein